MDLADARRSPWFHSIDFRPRLDYVSKSRFKGDVPPNYTLFGFYWLTNFVKFQGAHCLDVGTMDGLAAFIMRELGAASVSATDVAERPTFHFARSTLGHDVDYTTDVDLHSIRDAVGDRTFDVVLLAGVLYHVFDPLAALTMTRRLTKLGGLAIVETHFLPDEDEPIMRFNPGDAEGIKTTTNFFWRASLTCLDRMFHLCAFRVITRVTIGKRVTYLVRAVKPSDLAEASEHVRRIHADFMSYAHYRDSIDYDLLERGSDYSDVLLQPVPPQHHRLSVKQFKPDVPYQPPWAAGR